MLDAFETHALSYRAESLDELAALARIEGAALKKTISDYNANRSGTEPLGREYRPQPIEKPPFYAIRIQGMSITSTVGLAVDDSLRIIDENHKPISGLYAAGEVLGSSQTMGKATVGGMLVMPAIAFGRLLGAKILAWPGSAEAAA